VLILFIKALKVPRVAEILWEDLVVLKTINFWLWTLPSLAVVFIQPRVKCARFYLSLYVTAIIKEVIWRKH
jgi:hypothetical protein